MGSDRKKKRSSSKGRKRAPLGSFLCSRKAGFLVGRRLLIARGESLMTAEQIDKKTMFIINWILVECDEEHRDIDPRRLVSDSLIEMAAIAKEVWDGGAR
jgi:hypothetical protein